MGEAIKAFFHDWLGLGSGPAPVQNHPPADISYDEVAPEQIRRMNDHAQSAFAKGTWVTESIDP